MTKLVQTIHAALVAIDLVQLIGSVFVALLMLGVVFGGHESTCYVGWGNGSGAKISETENFDYVLTAAHCVNGLHDEVEIRYPLLDRPVIGRAIAVNRDIDVAILQHEKTGVAYEPMAPVQVGQRVWVDGLRSGKIETTVASYGDSKSGRGYPFVVLPRRAIGGDSGGPVRDESGKVVAVLHHATLEGYAPETICTAVQDFVRTLPRKFQAVICPGGICPPQPGQWQSQPPQYANRPILQEGPTGPQGPAGPPGPQGPPGRDAAVDYDQIVSEVLSRIGTPKVEIDYDQLAVETQKRLEPITVKYLDGEGQVVGSEVMRDSHTVVLPPVPVHYYNRNGEFVDSDSYPMNTPVRIRFNVINP